MIDNKYEKEMDEHLRKARGAQQITDFQFFQLILANRKNSVMVSIENRLAEISEKGKSVSIINKAVGSEVSVSENS